MKKNREANLRLKLSAERSTLGGLVTKRAFYESLVKVAASRGLDFTVNVYQERIFMMDTFIKKTEKKVARLERKLAIFKEKN